MKSFKSDVMDLQSTTDVKGGGDIKITSDNLTVNMTKAKKAVAMRSDTTIEVSGTLNVES